MFITSGVITNSGASPKRLNPVWDWAPLSLRLSLPLSVHSSSSALVPPLPPSPFPLLPFPRLWCPWGPAEAPIKPAVNGSNPVINGCVLQTRVWGCCSHGFIRWNGIGTHAQTRTYIHRWNRSCMHVCKMHALSHTHMHMLFYTASDGIASALIVLLLWMPCKNSSTITFKWLEMQQWCIMMIGAVALLFMPSLG